VAASAVERESEVPETHDFGRRDATGRRRRYWHVMRYPVIAVDQPLPLFGEVAHTREIEWPYRGGRGRLIRLFPTRRALVIGQWRDTHVRTEGEADLAIFDALDAPIPDVDVTDIKGWAAHGVV